MQAEDVSTEFLANFLPWFDANRKRLIVIGVVLVLGFCVWFFMKTHREQQVMAAGQAYTALQMSQLPTESAPQVAASYQQLAQQYAGTLAAQRAQLHAAAILFQAGKYDVAQKQFASLLSANSDSSLAPMAKSGMAACLEAEGKLADALSAYQEVANLYPQTAAAVNATFSCGRVQQLQGHLNQAISSYQSVMHSQLAGSLARLAAQRVNLLKTELAAKKGATPKAAATKPALNSKNTTTPTNMAPFKIKLPK